MSKTLTVNYSDGYSLASTASSPLTVNAGVTVSNTSGPGISSTLTSYVSITNSGLVVGTASGTSTVAGSGYGIYLAAAGGISNLAGARIAGQGGILAEADLNLYNGSRAVIYGQDYGVRAVSGAATVTNAGSISASKSGGILLQAGGSVTNNGSVTAYRYAIRTTGSVGNASNTGFVESTATDAGMGVLLQNGGSLGNSGTILSDFYGALIDSTVGTVVNSGTIASSLTGAGAGVVLLGGGEVTNQAGGFITGEWIGVQGGSFYYRHTVFPAITLTNLGSISAADGKGDGAAVWLHGPGVVINQPGASIQAATNGTVSGGPLNGLTNGGFGIVAYYQTTLVNYGTVGGGEFSFDAANTSGTFSNEIVMAPGAVFQSEVLATNASASSTPLATLVLLSGASAGTVSGFGAKYVGFKVVVLGNGADWLLGGTLAPGQEIDFAGSHSGLLTLGSPGSMQGTIFGFGAGDTLALAGVTATGVSLSSSNALTVEGAGATLAFDPAQNFASTPFDWQVSDNETLLTVQCFAAGTRIATDRGPVAVENLAEGVRVTTARGCIARVRWLGCRQVNCSRHPKPWDAWPVRIRSGAFGDGLPVRDLLLSPDHAVFIDDVLIPIRHLLNGSTIAQQQVDAVTYYHVELQSHDIVLAEELPCESYLDTGNRAGFKSSMSSVETSRPST